MFQDSDGRYVVEKVVHHGEAKHETENLVRDILKFDHTVYDRVVKELFPNGTANATPYFKFDPKRPDDDSVVKNVRNNLMEDE